MEPLLFEQNIIIDDPTIWKVIICDDDESVHAVTKLILRDMIFEGQGIEFICGFSADQTIRLIEEHQDTAVLFLDVVLEEPDAGLKVIEYVRDNLNNKTMQIILRTGHVKNFRMNDIISRYHINEFQAKEEITADKLKGVFISSLRSFKHARYCMKLNQVLQEQLKTLVRQELYLKKNEEDFYTLINAIADSILLVDGKGRILKANKSALKIFNYEGNRIIKKSYFEFLCKGDVEVQKRFLLHALHNCSIVRFRTFFNNNVFDVSVYPIENDNRKCHRAAILFRDATEQKKLERKVLKIADHERLSISNELHDELCQDLAGVSFRLKALEKMMPTNSHEMQCDIADMQKIIKKTLGRARCIARGLRPIALDNISFIEALKSMIEDMKRLYKIKIEAFFEGDFIPIDLVEFNHLYYIAREAVHNACKRSGNKSVKFKLSINEKELFLLVHNVKLTNVSRNRKGMGMEIMNYRAHMIGAKLKIIEDSHSFQIELNKQGSFF